MPAPRSCANTRAAEGDPYYPIPNPANETLFKRYEALAETESDVHFIGRLAQYRYYNMDQVVASALALSSKLIDGHTITPVQVDYLTTSPAPLAA